MKISRKHHFLPQFYLKGFTNNDGQFRIFNVKNHQSKQKGKLFYPSSHFYKTNSNTINFETGESDFIEKLYEKIDCDIAKIILKIRNGNAENRFNVSESDMPQLNNFASQIFWRNPANEKKLLDYINSYSLKELGLKIINSDGTQNIELSEQFKNEPEFYKSYRLLNSLIDPIRGFECRTQYHIFKRTDSLPTILSDNPIIFKNMESIKVYEDDYIIPLSNERIFIKRNLTKNFNHQLHYLIDLIQIKQSESYFAYTDLEYIKHLQYLDSENNFSLEKYKSILFESLK